MRTKMLLTSVAAAALALGISVTLAAATKTVVHLHPPMHTHMMTIEHATGTAQISYTAHDASIKLTTDGLPKPSAIKEHAYVLWLVNGSHKVRAGALKITGNMAGLHYMGMDVTFRKLVVTAEHSMTESVPMGPKVLVGAVMRH